MRAFIVINQDNHKHEINNVVRNNIITKIVGYVSFWTSGRLALSDMAF